MDADGPAANRADQDLCPRVLLRCVNGAHRQRGKLSELQARPSWGPICPTSRSVRWTQGQTEGAEFLPRKCKRYVSGPLLPAGEGSGDALLETSVVLRGTAAAVKRGADGGGEGTGISYLNTGSRRLPELGPGSKDPGE